MIERQRSVDVDTLTDEQLQALTAALSEKIKIIVDKACADANRYLEVYNMHAKMQVVIQEKE